MLVGAAGLVPDLWAQIARSQQQAMMGQQMGSLSSLAGLTGMMGMTGNIYASSSKPYRSGRGLVTYKGRPFMARTRSGLKARKVNEVLFWSLVALFGTFGIVLPIVLKLGTMLWGWALT